MKQDKIGEDVVYFRSSGEFRKWLDANHDTAREIWIGLYKKKSTGKGIVYSQALDEALCFGWIDGALKSIDDEKWAKRFTPRKPGSIWSNVNVKRTQELIELGRMNPAGLDVFKSRRDDRTGIYSYEQDGASFSKEFEKKFKSNKKAWDFFSRQAASYRKTSTHWVMRAKKEETRTKRLDELIRESSKGKRLARFGG
jgi:uncharacterized protein YdeI (YjbR/CyaY-like superfamily)